MEFWGINLTCAACEKEFSDDKTLHIRHLTLVEGQKASIKVYVDTEEKKKSQAKLLGVLTQLTPNVRVNVKLNHPVRFLLQSEHSASVSIVGHTFPRSLPRELSQVISPDYLSQWMEGNDMTDDENNSWNPAANLEKFIQTIWNDTSRPPSLQNSNRVVEITDEEEEEKKTSPQLPQAAADEASVSQKKDGAKAKKKDLTTVKPKEALVAAKEGHDSKGNQKSDKFKKPAPSEKATTATQTAETGMTRTLPGGVSYSVISLGQGKIATVGKRIKVKYQGFLAQTGKQFDHGLLEFTVGAGEMIKGFDLGVRGMLTKEKRKIFIPSPLGYGKQKVGPIPANSNLIFEVTLISVA